MAADKAGSSRLLTKLHQAMESKKFYEAHQLLRTLNFRYSSAKKYTELEELLYKSSVFLLDSNQIESGSDVAVMLSKLYTTADLSVEAKRLEEVIGLLEKMPSTPDRANFISGIMEWMGSSELIGKLHAAVARIYIREQCFSDAWRHVMRVTDGKDAAALTLLITSGSTIHREEFDLIVGNLIITFLVAKRVRQADQAYHALIKNDNALEVSPLLNGVRFLVECAKMGSPQAFMTIRDIYEPSFCRDPHLRKLVANAGKSLFNLQDRTDRSNNSFMPMLLNALLQPDVPTLD